jgi:hypothetical protein
MTTAYHPPPHRDAELPPPPRVTLLPPAPQPPRAVARVQLVLRVGLVVAVALAVLAMALLVLSVLSIRGAVRPTSSGAVEREAAASLAP